MPAPWTGAAQGADTPRPKLGAFPGGTGEYAFPGKPYQKPQLAHLFMINFDQGWAPLDGSDPDAAKITEAGWVERDHPGEQVVISYAGFPSNTGATLQACANRDYNSRYFSYGRALRQARGGIGLRNVILRVGWEWDGGGTPMSRTKAANWSVTDFKQCFRNIVDRIRAGYDSLPPTPSHSLRFDFNSTTDIFRYNSSFPNDDGLAQGYPGDGFVDIISVEGYDVRTEGCGSTPDERRSPITQDCRWANLERSFVLVRNFAQGKSKWTAIPEWGIWNTDDYRDPTPNDLGEGYDNPDYVRRLCTFARTQSNDVLYYGYFVGYSKPWHDLTLPLNDQAANAFRIYCGNGPL